MWYACCESTHGWQATQEFLPQLVEFYFSAAEKKILKIADALFRLPSVGGVTFYNKYGSYQRTKAQAKTCDMLPRCAMSEAASAWALCHVSRWCGYSSALIMEEPDLHVYLHGFILRFSKQGKMTWCSLMTASQRDLNHSMICRSTIIHLPCLAARQMHDSGGPGGQCNTT